MSGRKAKTCGRLKLEPFPCWLSMSFDERTMQDGSLAETLYEPETGRIRVAVRPETLGTEELPFVLAHESMHVVQFVEDYVEQRLDRESEAYLLQKVLEWIWKKCGRIPKS